MKYKSLILIISCLVLTFTFSICTAEDVKDELYKIGIGDVLSIRVLENEEFDSIATVSMDGTINMPYIGAVRVMDIDIEEAKEIITTRLREGYIKFPIVSVSLMKSISKKIFSYGHLRRIGEIPFEENMTIVKAMSIFGGISDNGLFGKLKIKRMKDGKYEDIVVVELNEGVIENSAVEEMILEPDDILFVEKNDSILMQGEIYKRGRVILEKGMTVLRVILEAGGAGENGMYGKVVIRRKSKGGSGGYKKIAESRLNDGVIEKSEVEGLVLQPDDILIIERNETFLIQGEALNRGRFVLEKGMTVLRAILQAGGVGENGKYGKVIIRRKIKGEPGGYKTIAEARLNAGVIENSEVEDLLLQPEDILIVEQNKTYFIYGEVNLTGEFVLKNNMTVFKALTIAKGFTKWGSASRVKILRVSNGGYETINVDIDDVIEGDAGADVGLQAEDIIMVSSGVF